MINSYASEKLAPLIFRNRAFHSSETGEEFFIHSPK
jgi:hypothetical protein